MQLCYSLLLSKSTHNKFSETNAPERKLPSFTGQTLPVILGYNDGLSKRNLVWLPSMLLVYQPGQKIGTCHLTNIPYIM